MPEQKTRMQTDIELLKTGTHRDSQGYRHQFQETDLDALCEDYDPTLSQAPLVIGHVETDSPAWGWVGALRRQGNKLLASLSDVPETLRELVRNGRYKYVSAGFYTPEASHNPLPGKYYLRHVGLLGATPPAIKGLAPVQFASAGTESVLELHNHPSGIRNHLRNWIAPKTEMPSFSVFVDNSENSNPANSACEENAKTFPKPQKQSGEFSEFLDAQLRAGRILPSEMAPLRFVLGALSGQGQFSETAHCAPEEWMRQFICQLPARVRFGPHAPESSESSACLTADGPTLGRMAQEYRARQAAKGINISASDAVLYLQGEHS